MSSSDDDDLDVLAQLEAELALDSSSDEEGAVAPTSNTKPPTPAKVGPSRAPPVPAPSIKPAAPATGREAAAAKTGGGGGMFSKLKGNVDRQFKASSEASKQPGAGWSKPAPQQNEKGKGTSSSKSQSLFSSLDGFFDKDAKKSTGKSKPKSSERASSNSSRKSGGDKKMIEMSKEQLNRLQKELVELRASKLELKHILESKASTSAASAPSPAGGSISSSKTKDLLSGMKMFGRSKSKPDVEAEIAAATAGLQEELAAERRALQEIRSEVTLHKETKDQLVHSMQDLQADLDDQRQSLKASQAALSEKNASLQATVDAQGAQIMTLSTAAAAADDQRQSVHAALSEKNASLQATVASQGAELSTLTAAAAAATAAADDQQKSYAISQADLSEKNGSLQAVVDSQGAQIKRLTSAAKTAAAAKAAAAAKEAQKALAASVGGGDGGGGDASGSGAAAAVAAAETAAAASAAEAAAEAEATAIAHSEAIAELEESLRTITTELEANVAKLEDATKASTGQGNEIEKLRSQLLNASDASAAELDEAHRTMAEALKTNESQLKHADELAAKHEIEIGGLRSQLAKAGETNVDLEASLRTLTEETDIKRLKFERVETAATEQGSEIEGLRSQLQKASDAASAAGRARQKAEWSLEEVEDKLRNRDASVASLEAEVSALSKDLTVMEERAGVANGRAEDTQTIMDELLVKCNTLEEELGQLRKTNTWYESELEASNNALTQTDKKSSESLSEMTKTHSKSTSESAKQISKLNAEIETMKRTVSMAASKLTEEMSAKKGAEAEAARFQKLLKASQDSVDESRTAGMQLEKRLAQVTSELFDMQKVKDALEASELALKTSEQESAMMAQASERAVESGNQTGIRLAEEEASNQKLTAEVDELIERLAIETTAVESLSTKLSDSEEATRSKTETVLALETTRDTLLAKMGTLTAEYEAATAALTEAETQSAAKAAELAAASETRTTEVSRLERELEDSEAQRKLDQKRNTKSIRDLSKQLQRLESGGGRRSPVPSPSSNSAGGMSPSASATPSPVQSASSSGGGSYTTPSRPMPASRRSAAATGNSPMTSQQAISRARSPRSSSSGGAHGVSWYKERLQFYESHTEELTTDLKAKSKIIQMYLLRENSGKLGPKRPGHASVKPAAAPGMMGRMLGVSTPNVINGMTHELAAEMNTRLQQVTEDALLKNIQLQESLEMMSRQFASDNSK